MADHKSKMYDVQLTISTTKRGNGARIDIHKLVHVDSQESLSSGSPLDQEEFTYVEHSHPSENKQFEIVAVLNAAADELLYLR
ncbi:hypothetical protein JTE90_015790 [Oedothorax gibbosus]|uniref:PLAT domain-containing protein n=1 Tax=Oedothorax gibbosus TaxID=931172 RepID=A0AAV6U094_9ARAC|nr:hypothetical protein JTE90_015790 [Oedothorax gibbosus]